MVSELVDNTTLNASLAFLCEQYPQELKTKSDYFYAVPYYFATRFQDWEALERIEPKINDGLASINKTCAETLEGWKPLTKPYTRIMQSYAAAYKALGTSQDSAKAVEILGGFWKGVSDVLREPDNKGLRYGNNDAVELLRLANLVLFNKAQDSTGQKLALDEVKKASAQALEGPGKALADDLAALAEGNPKQVISAWEKAVEVQDLSLIHISEPTRPY